MFVVARSVKCDFCNFSQQHFKERTTSHCKKPTTRVATDVHMCTFWFRFVCLHVCGCVCASVCGYNKCAAGGGGHPTRVFSINFHLPCLAISVRKRRATPSAEAAANAAMAGKAITTITTITAVLAVVGATSIVATSWTLLAPTAVPKTYCRS